jgi:hypothetical protein
MEDQLSVIDLLENFTGVEANKIAPNKLSDDQVEELAEHLELYYANSRTPAKNEDDMRIYPGGWVAGNWEHPDFRSQLYTHLLYHPSTVVHDPIAEWFNSNAKYIKLPPPSKATNNISIQSLLPLSRQSHGHYSDGCTAGNTRAELSRIIPALAEIRPLIKRGSVILIPQWEIVRHNQERILTAVRHDSRDEAVEAAIANEIDLPVVTSDATRGLRVTPTSGWKENHKRRAAVQDASYSLNKTIAIAHATEARYVPPSLTDMELLKAKIGRLSYEMGKTERELKIALALGAVELPYFSNLEARTLAKIHDSEDAFIAWRTELSNFARNIESSPQQPGDFAEEVRDTMRGDLSRRAKEVTRKSSFLTSLREAGREGTMNFSVNAISIYSAAKAFDANVSTASISALGGASILTMLARVLFAHKPEGSNFVLSTLVRSQKQRT